MEGFVVSKILSIVDVHNSDFLVILLSFSVLSLVSFTFLWFYNRRKFQSLEHDLPADVVKSYIDAIIQNSQVLKTSLFRGETGDAVMPLMGQERVVEKIKEVPVGDSKLQGKLEETQSLLSKSEKKVSELESMINGGDSKLKSSQNKIAELESQVEKLKSSAGSSGEGSAEEVNGLQSKLDEVSKEKDMLRERLQEYEIIEDDLANLKRLQQENEQLKKSLAEAQGESAPVAAAELAPAATTPAPAVEEAPSPEPVAAAEPSLEEVPDNVTELTAAVAEENIPTAETTEMAPAEEEEGEIVEEEKAPSNDPDDLLREFEKMLG